MISFRTRGEFEQEWNSISFEGDAEETLAHILAATLMRLDYEVEVSRDGGEFFVLGEDEGGIE